MSSESETLNRIRELREKIEDNDFHIQMLMRDNHGYENEIKRLLGIRITDGDISVKAS